LNVVKNGKLLISLKVPVLYTRAYLNKSYVILPGILSLLYTVYVFLFL